MSLGVVHKATPLLHSYMHGKPMNRFPKDSYYSVGKIRQGDFGEPDQIVQFSQPELEDLKKLLIVALKPMPLLSLRG